MRSTDRTTGGLVLSSGAAQTVTVNDSAAVNDMSITAPLAGATALTKAGAGRLSLFGDNGTYTGSITVNGGEMVAGHANASYRNAATF